MTAAFWLCLTLAALAWYSCVTVYVAFKGASDIRHMLERLRQADRSDDDAPE